MIPSRIVVFGSSSVYGRGDPENGGFVGLLRRWHEPRTPTNLVYNLGVGGDTSGAMLQRFESEVRHRRPDLLLLYFGLNDTRRTGNSLAPTAVSVEDFTKNTRRILEKSKEIATTIYISSFPIQESRTSPFLRDWYYLESDAKVFNKRVSELCRELEIDYLDVFERWSRDPDESIFYDGLHCNAVGHRRMFEELQAVLLKKYGLE